MRRTARDTWDPANGVGATATLVAAARARATNTENPLIDDPFAEPLVRAVGVDFFTRWATGELHAADIEDDAGPWGVQRMTDLLAARTRYFDAFFLDATKAGIRQAVILASGLDARGYRLPWPQGMTVFEIDQPEVLEFKATTLAAFRAEPTAILRAVPIDLRLDWSAALRQAGFDSDRRTAWIAEGLLPYLPPEAQDGLLDNITALSANGSELATETFVDAIGVGLTRVTQRWRDHGLELDLSGLGYEGERNEVVAYLDALGWCSVRTNLQELLATNRLSGTPQADGEVQILDNYYCTSILSQPR